MNEISKISENTKNIIENINFSGKRQDEEKCVKQLLELVDGMVDNENKED